MIYQKGYKTIAGNHCFNACIMNYLYYNNILISESDIFFLGQGYHLDYKRKGCKFEIESTIHSSGKRFLDNSQILYSYNQISNEKLAKQILLKSLIEEENISLFLMSKYLTYDKTLENGGEAVHIINVIGYNEEKNKIYISDGYVPKTVRGSIFEGWLDFSDVMLAWKMMNYQYIIFRFNQSSINIDKIKKGAFDNIWEYYFKDCFVNGDSNKIVNEYIWIQLIEELDIIFNTYSYKKVIGDIMYDINYQLRVNGFMMTQNSIFQMIKDRIQNVKILKEYEDIVDQWNLICLLIVKISYTKSQKQYENLKIKIWEILNKEKKILLKIQMWIESKKDTNFQID